MKKLITLGLLTLMITGLAQAARVGVVVDFPDGSTFSQCIQTDEGVNGYELANTMAKSTTWGPEHPQFGHSLCKIDGFGNKVTGTGCEWTGTYWAYWVIASGSTWTSMPVGHDGGETCWNRDPYSWSGHYCVQDKDVIGYVFGESDPVSWEPPPMRTKTSWSDICEKEEPTLAKKIMPSIDLSIEPADPVTGQTITVKVKDNRTGDPVKDANVRVYNGPVGMSKALVEQETSDEGTTKFSISETGKFSLHVAAPKFGHELVKLKISKPSTTTTTTSTLTTTTTTSTTTTTYKKPPHLKGEQKLKTTTTTIAQPKTIAAAVKHEPQNEGILTQLVNWLINLI